MLIICCLVWSSSLGLLATASSADYGVGCPSDFVAYDGNCYYVSKEGMDWYTAKQHCEGLSDLYEARLAKIESAHENDFVYKLVDGTNTWLGGGDQEVEGQYRWLDGTDMMKGFTYFFGPEPNDLRDGSDVFKDGEDCMGLWHNKVYPSGRSWVDLPCVSWPGDIRALCKIR